MISEINKNILFSNWNGSFKFENRRINKITNQYTFNCFKGKKKLAKTEIFPIRNKERTGKKTKIGTLATFNLSIIKLLWVAIFMIVNSPLKARNRSMLNTTNIKIVIYLTYLLYTFMIDKTSHFKLTLKLIINFIYLEKQQLSQAIKTKFKNF